MNVYKGKRKNNQSGESGNNNRSGTGCFFTQINTMSLFRNKRFMLDEMFQRNAFKFAILLEYENQCSFFHFSFRATLFFPNECPGLCQHRPGHSLGKK